MIKKILAAFIIYFTLILTYSVEVNADVNGILPSYAQAFYRLMNLFGAPQACSVVALGATANADSTLAFQTCVNLASATGGPGVIYIRPDPGGGCYNVGAINATKKPGLITRGNGQKSCVRVTGSSPTNKNWWDITQSGYADVTFENFKIIDDGGTTIPKVLFFVAADNTGLTTISGVFFKHMYVQARTSQAIIYGYALANSGGFSGYSCADSTFVQLNNGSSNTNPSLRNGVLVLDGINSRALASDYATVSTANPGSDGNVSLNCNYIDSPSGFGAGTQDNNIGLVHVTTGQVQYVGGSVQCLCSMLMVWWTNTEGTTLSDMVLQAPDGSVTITFFMDFGGASGQATNGEVALNELFWSVPKTGGCFICTDAPSSSTGGINALSVRNPDIGGNPNSANFLLDIGGCTGAPTSSITLSYLQMQSGANNVASCSSIDNHTSLINPGTVALGTGSDASRHQ